MKAFKLMAVVSVCALVGLLAATTFAVNIETVTVGDVGNAADDTGYGSVAYTYNAGTYEVTAGQYAEFLNSKGGVDTYGLYSTGMWSSTYGCKIERSGGGTVGNPYTYSVASDFVNRPVNFVSYWDSCRFANWLHNGQGNGDTETGAYTLTPNAIANNTVTRNADWKWAVTSEDEWYKAAYYNPVTNSYYDFPTSSNVINAGMANYGWTVPHTTNVGSYPYSSPYGTFDQGGNVWEWNESGSYSSYRRYRGGSYRDYDGNDLRASGRVVDDNPMYEDDDTGFRVVQLPEPGSAALLALGGFGLLRRRSIR